MMGIYVNGMEMPKNCGGCFLRFGQCSRRIYMENRPSDCPLIEVSEPHGRLIDADALMNEFKILQSGREIFGMELDSSFLSSGQELSTEWYCVEDAIEDAPTIIEAEEGE